MIYNKVSPTPEYVSCVVSKIKEIDSVFQSSEQKYNNFYYSIM